MPKKQNKQTICRINKCDRPRVAKGCCRLHYRSLKERICTVSKCHRFVPKKQCNKGAKRKYCSYHQSPKMRRLLTRLVCWRKNRNRNSVQSKTSGSPARKTTSTEFECPICFQGDGHETALIPCGHVVCNTCTSKISRCPFCRRLIHRELRLFKEK